MPCGGDPIVGGVWVIDDRRGTHLPGEAEGTGAVQGLQGGDGGRIIIGAQDDTAWTISRGEIDLENLGIRGRAVDVPHGLTIQVMPA